MCDTVWKLGQPLCHRLHLPDFTLEFSTAPVINYALYHCGMPAITRFVLKNLEAHPRSVKLSIALEGFSDLFQQQLEDLGPGQEVSLPPVRLNLRYDKLQWQEGAQWQDGARQADLLIALDDRLVFRQALRILGFYEWPFDPAFRKSLACFVQPSHPQVYNIVSEAQAQLWKSTAISSFDQWLLSDREFKTRRAVQAVYDGLKDNFQVSYVPAAPSQERDSQVIRPPHIIFPGAQKNQGSGTCIDLCLLFAACLENLWLQPLIILVAQDASRQHALLGCWQEVAERFEPVWNDSHRLKEALADGRLLVLETTGVTDAYPRKLSFDQALAAGEAHLHQNAFLFAVDIAAARQTVPPLQFPANPLVTRVLGEAELLARREKNPRLETRHLLFALFLTEDQTFREILAEAGVNDEALARVLALSPSLAGTPGDLWPRPTLNYRRVLEDAKLIASDGEDPFVETHHLLYALLLSQSKMVDDILTHLGVSRQELRHLLESRLPWGEIIAETMSDFR